MSPFASWTFVDFRTRIMRRLSASRGTTREGASGTARLAGTKQAGKVRHLKGEQVVDIEELRRSRVLRDLDDRELAEVAKLGTVWKRPPGVRIISEGSQAAGVYLLQEGRVQVRMTSRDGHEVTIDELGQGDLFGWSSVLNQAAFKSAIWTIEECTLVVIDGKKLRALFDANNHIGYRVVREIAEVIASRLERLRSKLADQPFSEEWLSPVRTFGSGNPPS